MFIEKSDYLLYINTNILDDITEVNDELVDNASRTAISLVKGYLNARYDVNAIFNATGSQRHATILEKCIDMALFTLHARINPRKIPELRRERNKEAKEWLIDVSESIINPPDLPVLSNGQKDYIDFGSNPRRENRI